MLVISTLLLSGRFGVSEEMGFTINPGSEVDWPM